MSESLATRWPYAKDFLALDWGPLRAITTGPDKSSGERKIVELDFAGGAVYKFPISSSEAAQRAYAEILQYLCNYHYNTHKALFEDGRFLCEIEFASFRRMTRDFARDIGASEPKPVTAMPDDPVPELEVLLKQVARRLGRPVATVRAQLGIDEAGHQVTAHTKAKPRLRWEKDALPGENPAQFAWRAYRAEAKAGTLHRGLIGQEDRPLAVKLANWLRSNPMPKGIDIPTKPEWNTRQLQAKADKPLRETRTEEGRLRAAQRYRTTKAAISTF